MYHGAVEGRQARLLGDHHQTAHSIVLVWASPHQRSRLSVFTEAELDPGEWLCSWPEVPKSYAERPQVQIVLTLRERDCYDTSVKNLLPLSSPTVNHTAKRCLVAKSGSVVLTYLPDHLCKLMVCTLLTRPHSFQLNREEKEQKLVGNSVRSCCFLVG